MTNTEMTWVFKDVWNEWKVGRIEEELFGEEKLMVSNSKDFKEEPKRYLLSN